MSAAFLSSTIAFASAEAADRRYEAAIDADEVLAACWRLVEAVPRARPALVEASLNLFLSAASSLVSCAIFCNYSTRQRLTNAAFATFAEATGYVTDAEAFGYSAVFHLALAVTA
jgi:hypothetical protein